MTLVTYFILPTLFVNKVAAVGAEYVPIVGPMVKFTTKASKVVKATNPVSAATRGVGAVVISCSGPVFKYPALCALWFSTAVVSGATVNSAVIAFSVEMAEIILEEWIGG